MTVQDPVHRPRRLPASPPPAFSLAIERPPPPEAPVQFQIVYLAIPLLGSISLLAYGVMSGNQTLLVIGGIIALGSMLIPVLMYYSNKRRAASRRREQLDRYDNYLTAVNADVAKALSAQHEYLQATSLSLVELDTHIAGGHLWERRLDDRDFLDVDLGTGSVPSTSVVKWDATWSDRADNPEAATRIDQVVAESKVVTRTVIHPNANGRALDRVAQVRISVQDAAVISIEGPANATRAAARSVLHQLLIACGPDELVIAAALPPMAGDEWRWLRSCPHAQSPLVNAECNPLVYTSAADLQHSLSELLKPRLRVAESDTWSTTRAKLPRLLVVVDQYSPFSELAEASALTTALGRALELDITILALCVDSSHRPATATTVVAVGSAPTVVDLTGRQALLAPNAGTGHLGTVFQPYTVSVATAEHTAAMLARKRLAADHSRGPGSSTRLVDLLAIDNLQPGTTWARPDQPEWLKIPIGVGDDGRRLMLDLKESAAGGDGPHGVIIGATGSGKSELLRSIVCSLAARHSPDELNLMLTDFKGGASFQAFEKFPHVVGVATNLIDDPRSLDRIREALSAEILRRQADLDAAGANVQKISEYYVARTQDPSLPAMPYLLVVIDEFGEMIASREDFLGVLVSVARLGRSVGVHLLLANQRLDAGLVKGLESFLSYRVALRTFTPEDSRAVLGSRIAADLPPLPGAGYLQTADALAQFQSAYLGPGGIDADSIETSLRTCARPPALWLPPLPDPAKGQALLANDSRLSYEQLASSHVAIGLVDVPSTRSQPVLDVDLSAVSGMNTMVVGAARSGRSQCLATVIAQLGAACVGSSIPQILVLEQAPLLTRDPDLKPLIAGGAAFDDPSKVARIVRHVEGLVYAGGPANAVGFSDCLLIIDGIGPLLERFPDLTDNIGRIITDGRQVGVLLAISANRWSEISPKLLERFGTRIELSVSEPSVSMHRLRPEDIRFDRPGRGRTMDGRSLQIAVHQLGNRATANQDQASTRCVFRNARQAPSASVTQRKLTLLEDLAADTWRNATGTGTVLGLHEDGFHPVRLPLGTGSHFILSGDRGTGRSRTLARLLNRVGIDWPGTQAFLIDYRGDLFGMLDDYDGLTVSAACNVPQAETLLGAFTDLLLQRIVQHGESFGATVSARGTQASLFPPLLLVIDDLEMVSRTVNARPMYSELYSAVHIAREANLTILVSETGTGSQSRIDALSRGLDETTPWYLEFSVAKAKEPLRSGRRGRRLPAGQAHLVRDGYADALLQVLPPQT